jgi:hypothetical protein
MAQLPLFPHQRQIPSHADSAIKCSMTFHCNHSEGGDASPVAHENNKSLQWQKTLHGSIAISVMLGM